VLADNGFFGPYQYPGWVLWTTLGLVLLVVVAGWYVFVARFTARRLPPEARVALRERPPVDLPTLRARYLGLIDEIASASERGLLDDRAVHSRLSLLLRFFVHETDGVDTHVMTLADLRETGLPRLTGAVEQFYPPAFERLRPGDPATALEIAREVVRSWA
jgi:hypothetical protein